MEVGCKWGPMDSSELKPIPLSITIDSSLPRVVPNAVSFETGASKLETLDPSIFAYEHHGAGFTPLDRGALPVFFEDLILGRPLPLTFVTHSVGDIDTIVAMALFSRRDLAIHPATPGLVMAADLVHRRGFSALAHIDQDLGRFFQLLRSFVLDPRISKREFGERVSTSIQWTVDYVLESRLPHVGSSPNVQILQQGSNGFVVASCAESDIEEGWVELYRAGFLRGLLVGPEGECRQALVAKKSAFLELDLVKAAQLLNELEGALNGNPGWTAVDLFAHAPQGGTRIPLEMMVEVLVRV